MTAYLSSANPSTDDNPAPEIHGYGDKLSLYESDGHMRPLDEIEADIIRMAIRHYGGQMSEVARRLGIGRSTLYRKLGELGIKRSF